MADAVRRHRGVGVLRRLRGTRADVVPPDDEAARPVPVAMPVARAVPRERVRVVGQLCSVNEDPAESRWLEAELDDGSGTVVLVWMGRRAIRGIEVGRRLAAEGCLSGVAGRPTIYNPRYELLP